VRLGYLREMASSYELTGRTRQKQRTRDALVAATRRLLGEGTTPSVEQVAEAAGVSRPTAYRYFPNQRALLVAAHPRLDATSLLPDLPPDDPRARLRIVVDTTTRWILEFEAELRTSLRLSLEVPAGQDPLSLRQGRAIGWIGGALSPLADRLSAAELELLAMAIRSATGIEAYVWLTDVAGRTPEEAAAVMRWSALALLDGALGELGPPRPDA
jgi:AcrR family transcriptional regulator